MNTMMGLINLEHEHHFFHELTYFRNGASVPFAGRYRLIDFALSNMVNSNIEEVAIFTRTKYRSLMDHLGTGRTGNWTVVMVGYLFYHPIGMIRLIFRREIFNSSIIIAIILTVEIFLCIN
ncbi:sugar phosphate nucleotidyltransferase [Bacillus sp. N9]